MVTFLLCVVTALTSLVAGGLVGYHIGFSEANDDWLAAIQDPDAPVGTKYMCCMHCDDPGENEFHKEVGVNEHTIGCNEPACFKGNVIVTEE